MSPNYQVVNVLATAESRKDDAVLQKVGALYHTEAVKQYEKILWN